ncbi:MAG: UDP-2,3-diacylglucosamine diphosphatase [Victivallales bacterium]|nr:UDP-2,3-diacylglucosamine diphosphatase [Victivallales bacterium]
MKISRKQTFRTLFISDLHLGTKLSRPEELLEFLQHVEIQKLYLVGDIFDVRTFKRKLRWSTECTELIGKIMELAKKKIEVVYIPGNHDRELRKLAGPAFPGIRLDDIHRTCEGKSYLVLHGDEFDGMLREKLMFLYAVGDWSYDLAVVVSKVLNSLTRKVGVDWSLSKYLKSKVKRVIQTLNNFEKLVVHEARRRMVDGVICGHIHTPELKIIGGMTYANCGCWTETCSAVVEHIDGHLEMLEFKGIKELRKMLGRHKKRKKGRLK